MQRILGTCRVALSHLLPYGRLIANEKHRKEMETLWGVRRATIQPKPGPAAVILPAALWAEKEGVYGCTELRYQLLDQAVEPQEKARPDFDILCDLARRLGHANPIPFGSPGRPDYRAGGWLRPQARPSEVTDSEYPLYLTTGRVVEHWHTATMTQNARGLRNANLEAVAEMNPADLQRLGLVAAKADRKGNSKSELA